MPYLWKAALKAVPSGSDVCIKLTFRPTPRVVFWILMAAFFLFDFIGASALLGTAALGRDGICGGDIIAEHGTISSPNFPNNYPTNVACVWNITVPENFNVGLQFHTFKLENSLSCKHDFVEIRDGHAPHSTILDKVCGVISRSITKVSTTNKMAIKFKSDAEVEAQGFSATFHKKGSLPETATSTTDAETPCAANCRYAEHPNAAGTNNDGETVKVKCECSHPCQFVICPEGELCVLGTNGELEFRALCTKATATTEISTPVDDNGCQFWQEVRDDCRTKRISNSSEELQRLSKVVNGDIQETAEKLFTLTSAPDSLAPEDLVKTKIILKNIADSPFKDQKVIKFVAGVVDNVMKAAGNETNEAQSEETKSSFSFGEGRIHFYSDRARFLLAFPICVWIIHLFERTVSTAKLETDSFNITTGKGTVAALETRDFSAKDRNIPTGLVVKSPGGSKSEINIETVYNGSQNFFNNSVAAITLPLNFVAECANRTSKGNERITSVVYRNFFSTNEQDKKISSYVVRVDLRVCEIQNLKEPLTVFLKPLVKNGTDLERISCAAWDKIPNEGSSQMSVLKCVSKTKNGVTFKSNRMGYFGLLLAAKTEDISEGHIIALAAISYFGCGLSISGLAITIMTYCLFKKWRAGYKHQILVNLSASLSVLLVTYVAGINARNAILCKAVAILLHYFLLSSFSWMFAEAIIQYLCFVKIWATYIPQFMRKTMICAWGFPLVIVSIVLAVDYNVYGQREDCCWISENALVYSVTLPLSLLLVANAVAFALIVHSLFCKKAMINMRTNQNKRKQDIIRFRASVCIFILLGFTWGFGLLAVGDAYTVFQYLFALTAALQGFLIFVFYVLWDKEARKMWKNLFLGGGRSYEAYSAVSHSVPLEKVRNGITSTTSICHNHVQKI